MLKKIILSCVCIAISGMSNTVIGTNPDSGEVSVKRFVSGVTSNGSDIGFYLLDENLEPIKKISSFEEIIALNNWIEDVPTDKASFDNFMSRYSETANNEPLYRISKEIIFCCLKHLDLRALFEKLDRFVNLLDEYPDDTVKETVNNSLVFALENNFFQLMYEIDEVGKSKEDLSVPLIIKKYNEIFEHINYPFRLCDTGLYQIQVD